jgi:peroxiredoxin Q/BCP
MKAYQDGIAKLTESDSVVFGLSVDPQADNAKFAKEIGATFPILSDTSTKVTKDYGVFNDNWKMASRVTFVVDKEGIIRHVVEGKDAVNPDGAIQMCATIHKKKPSQ